MKEETNPSLHCFENCQPHPCVTLTLGFPSERRTRNRNLIKGSCRRLRWKRGWVGWRAILGIIKVAGSKRTLALLWFVCQWSWNGIGVQLTGLPITLTIWFDLICMIDLIYMIQCKAYVDWNRIINSVQTSKYLLHWFHSDGQSHLRKKE